MNRSAILGECFTSQNSFDNPFWLILTGVFVFVVGQYILELIVRPHKEYRTVKTRISSQLKYFANVICNPLRLNAENLKDPKIEKAIENYQKASNEIRILSCELEAKFYDNFWFIRKLFLRDNVSDASSLLIGISNKLFQIPPAGMAELALTNSDDIQKIKEHLNLN
jgi:hypothetical protein